MTVELLPELLSRCRAGERDAFDPLVRLFHPYALAIAVSILGGSGGAEDAVQSAFVTVLTRVQDLREPAAFPGWLRQVVRTECDRLTRGAARPTMLAEDQAGTDGPPSDASIHRELCDQVRAAVAALPPAQRRAVELYYLDELPHADVARVLDVPAGTVRRRLHDARNALRPKLKSQLPI